MVSEAPLSLKLTRVKVSLTAKTRLHRQVLLLPHASSPPCNLLVWAKKKGVEEMGPRSLCRDDLRCSGNTFSTAGGRARPEDDL